MLLTSIILALVIPANLLIGSLVFMRQYRVRAVQYFGISILAVCFWALGDLLMLNAADQSLVRVGTLLFLIAPMVTALFLLFFTYSFLSANKPPKWIQLSGYVAAFVLSVAAVFSSSLFITVSITSDIASNQYNTIGTSMPGYFIYSLFFSFVFIMAYINLFMRYRRERSLRRMQILYVSIGIIITSALAWVTNLLLPSFGISGLVWMGPVFSLAFVAATVYAIVKHRLFDVRLVVARSLGYVLSIFALAALFGLVTFVLINQFLFTSDTVSTAQQVTYTLLAVVIAFAFPPIKRFFDKITNKIFYRDAYDPQQLLDGLNKTLVSTIELRSLLHWVSQILGSTLKTEFTVFDIQQNSGKERLVGTPEDFQIPAHDLAFIKKMVPTLHQKVLLTDELDDHPKLQKALRDNNISVIAHLVDSPREETVGLGYLILGNKKSGNPYSSEDARILEIITDELVIAVQNALRFDEIQNFNLTLQQKVDDATHKLRTTNEKLKQLDQTKDDFISMASHQLRTPLTSVKGYVSMVLEGDAGKITKQQEKLLEQAFVSSQRMVYLIADLLNVSRLRTGKFVIEAKPTNLADVVSGEIEQLVETAKGRNLELEYKKPKTFPVLNLDETKTRQNIMNFVDNAIYYTPAGGKITVNLIDKPESVELTVVDNGLGVPKHEQQHLFTKFYRAQNAKKARPDGTGLGLFMAKKVIVAQGGAVIFSSQEGKGSTFGFSFPKSKLLVK